MGKSGRIRKWRRRVAAAAGFVAVAAADDAFASNRGAFVVRVDASRAVASFHPDEAFGAGVDGLEKGETEKVYAPRNRAAMAGAPYRRLAYRLRTELGVEAWHWNPKGAWSDAANRQGYWTSSETTDAPLLASYGYRLPRRGSTFDQAGNDGYSRLADGDETTFWKSNPHLDARFTGEDDGLHPQWVLIDLGARRAVNALRILWGEPHAVRYEVQYWDGRDTDSLNDLGEGVWRPFADGRVAEGQGGDALLRLGGSPTPVRFVRILLSASSGPGADDGAASDVRDRLGYAIRELYLGLVDEEGRFHDAIRHGTTNRTQTTMVVSSTDPWHRESDLDPNIEQPGFDRILASGLSRGRPILTPVGVAYDTPDNAAAQLRFLKSRGFPMTWIELGEEPDGQNMTPEHYAALYLQFAKVVREVDPALIPGGPGFQSEVEGWNALADAGGERSWMKRFIGHLRRRGRLEDFGFFSFEWYPFDDLCDEPRGQLIRRPDLMSRAFARLRREGVPDDIPWILSEYGYSSFAGRAEVELPAALLNAEIVARFLTLGGRAAYFYGLEPNTPIRELDGCAHPDRLWGNLMMVQAGADGDAKWLLPAWHGARMLTEEWAEPGNGRHELFQASAVRGTATTADASAYAVRRPDGRWALLVLNKSDARLDLAQVLFTTGSGDPMGWSGPLEVTQYSSRQYVWRADGENGHPARSEPPELFRTAGFPAAGGPASPLGLPPLSLTVIRGAGPSAP